MRCGDTGLGFEGGVSQTGLALEHAAADLKADREIVLAAVSHAGSSMGE